MESESIQRTAILGGAFDPITLGHIMVAECVLGAGIEIDDIWLMPCYKHAYGKKMTGGTDRIKMCQLAAAHSNGIQASSYEIDNEIEGGTLCMLEKLKSDFPCREFSVIIGLDNAYSIDKWINCERLKREYSFIVVSRAGVVPNESVSWFREQPHIYLEKDIMEISSTQIRKMISLGASASAYLHKDVLNFISDKSLYSS